MTYFMLTSLKNPLSDGGECRVIDPSGWRRARSFGPYAGLALGDPPIGPDSVVTPGSDSGGSRGRTHASAARIRSPTRRNAVRTGSAHPAATISRLRTGRERRR